MTLLYNRADDKGKRKRLRQNMTEAEKILWEKIRKKQINGHKFRRQYSIAGFVVDFYCPKLKLAIELDGEVHLKEDVKAYDKRREWIIKSAGIEFLRFTNEQVINNLRETIRTIRNKVWSMQSPE